MAIYSLTSIIGKPLAGYVAERVGELGMLLCYLQLTIPSILLYTLIDWTWAMALGAVLMGLVANSAFGIVPMCLARRFPAGTRGPGLGIGYAMTSLSVGAPYVIAVFTTRSGPELARRGESRTLSQYNASGRTAPSASAQWEEVTRYPDPAFGILDPSFTRYRLDALQSSTSTREPTSTRKERSAANGVPVDVDIINRRGRAEIREGTMQLDHGVPNKRWIRIIPPVMIVYIFAFMDRVNFGFAMAGGMTQELNISAFTAGWPQGCSSSAISCFRCPEGTSPKKVPPGASLR